MTGTANKGAAMSNLLPKKSVIRDFSWYVFFAVINFCLNIFLTAALHEWFSVPETLAFAITICLAFIVSFLSFRYVVVRGAKDGSASDQFRSFFLASAFFRLIEYVSFIILNVLLGVYYLIAIVFVLGISFFVKFIFYRRRVFVPQQSRQGKSETRPLGAHPPD
jgi:putative flippase GtrA